LALHCKVLQRRDLIMLSGARVNPEHLLPVCPGFSGQLRAVDLQRTRVRRQFTSQQAQQGGFATAVTT
jgi:hypothetical protein